MNTNAPTRPKASAVSTSYYRMAVCFAGIVAFALLTAAGAAVKVPVPGTPVPITLQTLFVVLAGVTLGPWLGTASMGLYLLMGLAGYGVFAGETATIPQFPGPTAGYLIGFILAQPIIGNIARKSDRSWFGLTAATLAGTAIIFASGLVWLKVAMGATVAATLSMGLYPFLVGAVVKGLMVVWVGRALPRFARW